MKKIDGINKLKIMTRESAIELQKQPDKRQIVVKIDGRTENNEETLADHGVDKSYDQVSVNTNGINVRFDGEEASIKVEHYLNLLLNCILG